MITISVIVPIFHGKRYIEGLIRQIEACKTNLEAMGECDLELILVNDAPDDVLDDAYSSKIRVRVFNTEVNRGIHGARVYGLWQSSSEYILFLDQDDLIRPGYFVSQLRAIGNQAAAVCRLIHENKNYYNYDFPFERMMTKEYMLDNGCSILSPGQVLLRRSAIPEAWKENIIENNGADDFFLWLCMLAQGHTFALNNDILFEHIVDYRNASGNSNAMTKSEHEIVSILKEKGVFDKADWFRLDRMLAIIMERRLAFLDKFHKMFYILDMWMSLKEQNREIASYLAERGHRSIAIYGMGQLARRLLCELEGSAVSVRYLIDRNSDFLEEDFPVCSPEAPLQAVDAIIIALVQGEEAIRCVLEQRICTEIKTISEVISEMSTHGGA